MGKRPYFQFFGGDWMRDPHLSKCAPATRGIWIDLLCAMNDSGEGEITGTVAQLARIGRCTESEMRVALADLEATETAEIRRETNKKKSETSVTRNANVRKSNGNVTVRCRRLYREAKLRQQTALRVRRHRSKTECNAIRNEELTNASSYSYSKEYLNTNGSSNNSSTKNTHTKSARVRVEKTSIPVNDHLPENPDAQKIWDALAERKLDRAAEYQDWEREIADAFRRGFTADQFVGCIDFTLGEDWRTGRITAEIVGGNLQRFVTKGGKPKTANNSKPKGEGWI